MFIPKTLNIPICFLNQLPNLKFKQIRKGVLQIKYFQIYKLMIKLIFNQIIEIIFILNCLNLLRRVKNEHPATCNAHII
jgi:hypothetical protein